MKFAADPAATTEDGKLKAKCNSLNRYIVEALKRWSGEVRG
jgi:hypothetical protein